MKKDIFFSIVVILMTGCNQRQPGILEKRKIHNHPAVSVALDVNINLKGKPSFPFYELRDRETSLGMPNLTKGVDSRTR